MLEIADEVQEKIDNLDEDIKEFINKLIEENAKNESRLERILKQSDAQQLQLAKLNEKVEAVAITDALTSSFNRLKSEEILQELLNEQKIFSIMIVDVDNFRKIGEKHSAAVADQVLVQLAKIVKRFINNNSFFARWSRDSFIVIDEKLSLDDMVERAEEICDAVEEFFFTKVGRVTASIGVSSSNAGSTMQNTVQQLLQTLKRAKVNGKNQVSI